MYEGKVKSSQPSLHETWDKRPLGRELDRSWCLCHTMSMGLHGHWRQHTGKVKSCRLSRQVT